MLNFGISVTKVIFIELYHLGKGRHLRLLSKRRSMDQLILFLGAEKPSALLGLITGPAPSSTVRSNNIAHLFFKPGFEEIILVEIVILHFEFLLNL